MLSSIGHQYVKFHGWCHLFQWLKIFRPFQFYLRCRIHIGKLRWKWKRDRPSIEVVRSGWCRWPFLQFCDHDLWKNKGKLIWRKNFGIYYESISGFLLFHLINLLPVVSPDKTIMICSRRLATWPGLLAIKTSGIPPREKISMRVSIALLISCFAEPGI